MPTVHTLGRKIDSTATPQPDLFGEETVVDATPTTIVAFVMPEDSHAFIDILAIAWSVDGSGSNAFRWVTDRYGRVGALAPAGGIAIEVQTPADTTAGTFGVITDGTGLVSVQFTADAGVVAATNITAQVQARVMIIS